MKRIQVLFVKYPFLLISILLIAVVFFLNSCASSKVHKTTDISRSDSAVNITTEVKKELESKVTDETITTTTETEESFSETKADTLKGERSLKDLQAGKEIIAYDGEMELKTILDSATGFVKTTVVQMPKLIKTTKKKEVKQANNIVTDLKAKADSSNHTKSDVKKESKVVIKDKIVTPIGINLPWWLWLIILLIITGTGYYLYNKFSKK